ncbi:hypothetical protein KAJ27_07595 [bacterium]|nr:hypothetical protein [bacterium]
MQKKQTTIYQKCYTSMMGIIWVAGLLIAGSDSPYMPWVNGIGLILFLCASIMLGRFFQTLESNKDLIITSKSNKKIKTEILKPQYSKMFIQKNWNFF